MLINFSLICVVFVIHFIVNKNKKKIFNNHFLDIPDQSRKIHKKPTYLIGGHFIFISYLFFLLLSSDNSLNLKFILFFVFTGIFLIGILDDLKDLKPILKITLVLIIYLILTYFDNDFLLTKIYFETFEKNYSFGSYSYIISPLCILLLINAINLIDGINGLAMMIFIIFYTFLYYFIDLDLNIFVLIFYLFIFFNIYKGNYFLGNSGSLMIGAIIGFFTIKAYNQGFIENNFSAEDIFILFLVPGIDMFRLFLQRIIKKENPFKADKSHLHHLLIKRFSIQIVLFSYFFVIVLSSFLAFNDYLPELLIIFTIITGYFIIFFFVNKNFKNFKFNEK